MFVPVEDELVSVVVNSETGGAAAETSVVGAGGIATGCKAETVTSCLHAAADRQPQTPSTDTHNNNAPRVRPPVMVVPPSAMSRASSLLPASACCKLLPRRASLRMISSVDRVALSRYLREVDRTAKRLSQDHSAEAAIAAPELPTTTLQDASVTKQRLESSALRGLPATDDAWGAARDEARISEYRTTRLNHHVDVHENDADRHVVASAIE